MIQTNKLLIAATLVAVAMFSCKKDDPAGPCNNFNLSVALQAEADAVSQAATVYGQNPTTQNCISFRNAYQAYLDAAADLQGCANATGQGAEYAQAIADAQAALDGLQC